MTTRPSENEETQPKADSEIASEVAVPAPTPTGKDIPSAHATETYLPRRREARRGKALCLSGGGFRAALFHLGALRRLNELGILSQVDRISSVSGGSIIAAHLATYIHDHTPTGQVWPGWEEYVEEPFVEFTSRNMRTGPILKRLLPWNLFRSSTAVEALAAAYEHNLTRLKLRDLPDHPHFVFCATDMAYAVNWIFEKKRVGDYMAGYTSPPGGWTVARAVAASSCFPPIFAPLPAGIPPDRLAKGKATRGPGRDALVSGLRLTDGGVYDNMGLEPVWKDCRTVLVSDGGAPFARGGDKGLLWRLGRYTSIVDNQARGLRKRWLISSFILGDMAGAYWGIGSAAGHYAQTAGQSVPPGYSEALVESTISRVRTDMDSFSDAEQSVLRNHGYFLADAAIRQHVPELATRLDAPLNPPCPDWLDEGKVAEALKDSSTIQLLGR